MIESCQPHMDMHNNMSLVTNR